MNGGVNTSGTAIDSNGSIWRAKTFGTCDICQRDQCVLFQQEPDYEWDERWRCRPCVEDIGKKMKREYVDETETWIGPTPPEED